MTDDFCCRVLDGLEEGLGKHQEGHRHASGNSECELVKVFEWER